MLPNKLSVIFIVILKVLHTRAQYSACMTPSNLPGKCVPTPMCMNIQNALNSGKLTAGVKRYIEKSKCSITGSTSGGVCCDLDEISQPSEHPNLRLLDLEICGDNSQNKVHRGNLTKVFDYPWMAMLRYETSQGLQNKCGGTIINARYVLTAAHCIKPLGAELKQVRLGEHNLDTDIDCNIIAGERECARPVQDIEIESTIIHPSYSKRENDIALIRLARPADLSKSDVVPICLPVTKELQNYAPPKYIVTGWGLTENKTSSRVLLQAIVPHFETSQCGKTLRVKLPDTQFCAGGDDFVDNCQGDSGGPLQYPANLNRHKYIQFGIVSYGQRHCGMHNVPGVYTKVAKYVDWILDNLKP